jgi:peroxiredoxin
MRTEKLGRSAYRARMSTWTVIGELGEVLGGDGDEPVLTGSDLAAATGWAPKPQGWCRGDECIPASVIGSGATAASMPAEAVAAALGSAFALDAAHRLAVIGNRPDVGGQLSSGSAPDVELPGVDGATHRVFEQATGKTLVVAFASWCGCRYDLPAWQRLRDELADEGFGVVGIAIDESVELAAPWAEPVDFPVLVDTDRVFADSYGLDNVPTIFWVDEDRTIVRQPSTEFPDDSFTSIHGVESGPHLDALRAWVREGQLPTSIKPGSLGSLSADQRQARAEFRLALELSRRGEVDAAAERVAIADALAPDDFTIWRAGMQLVGGDPFGAEFFERYTEWQQRHGGPLQVPD